MHTESGKEVAILLLAAGPSRRLGSPKQLLQYKNRSLLRFTTEIALASKAYRAYVVLGAEADRLGTEIADLRVDIIQNPDWEEGIASSIRAGVGAVPGTTNAILIMLCDQPLVSVTLLNDMIDAYHSSGKRIVACEYGETLGAPALFDGSLVADLVRLTGDRGAKQVIATHAAEVCKISFPEGLVDIDTMNDYQSLAP